MSYISKISKILYSNELNNYKIYFITQKNELETYFIVSASDAKNIALVKEGIESYRLKTYDLLVDILSVLKINIIKIVIKTSENKIFACLNLKYNKKSFELIIDYVDAIILSIKLFINIHICHDLFDNDNKFVYKTESSLQLESDKVKKIKNLKYLLKDLVDNEEYESAALIRDRINKIIN
tara:strand:- start:448 stop:990 length:543 start_codon:yes stop_codon:yes gene_type:complete